MNLTGMSDSELKGFIVQMFKEYDRDKNGTLQAPQLALFFTDLYKSLGYNVIITLPVAQQVIKQISQTGSHRLSPYQIFCAFKVMSANTNAYFQQFEKTSPLSNVHRPESSAMDLEDCPEWAWPQK